MLFLVVNVGLRAPAISAQATDTPIPATKALEAPACSDVGFGGFDINVDLGLGSITLHHVPSPERGNPEWKVITLDPTQPTNLQPPTILEGFVSPQPSDQTSSSQSTSEVSEEDLWWNHFTHDFTFKVLPDPGYQHLLSSWVRSGQIITNPGWTADFFASFCTSEGGLYNGTDCLIPDPGETCALDSTGRICHHTDMEVEWDHASLMDEKEGFQRIWGAVPEFVWPAVNDRVWVSGRWIFDCGHPGSFDVDLSHVQFGSEIHPPRALVTFRLNHPALDSFPISRGSAPNFPAPQSYLPVTGVPATPLGTGPTNVPVTEADIFVTGNGGAANDLCSITAIPCAGHTGRIIPVNDRNYVFDIYPPGTDYLGFAHPRVNGTFGTGPPVPDASLQWRTVDHSEELPTHTCDNTDNTVCKTVDPIICLLDSSTPPPNQTETGCPAVPAQPTRLRVILPFKGSSANYFAKTILLGWDDVPTPANSTLGVRTFKVTLHALTVKDNGSGCCNNSDWRVFVNVGGQYRYISRLFEANSDGTSVCGGADPLTNNGNNDCYLFDTTPWTVSVQDGTPIHVAVGGFVARGLEDSSSDIKLCRSTDLAGGCATPTDFDHPEDEPFFDLGLDNDDRIGTYEFDLNGPDYKWILPDGSDGTGKSFTTAQFGCGVFSITGCSLRYKVEFAVQEIAAATAPASAPLQIGDPHFNRFVTSVTPLVLSTASTDAEGFQYRFHLQGAPLPTYATVPFPVHWTHADLQAGPPPSVPVSLNVGNPDGPYDFQYSAESFGNLLEPRHTAVLTLDNTPPVVTITQPAPTQYGHSAALMLNFSVSDGSGSGVKTVTSKLDGQTAAQFGASLDSGQTIYLYSMALGTHTFSVDSVDNVNNAGTSSVVFTIAVTPDSLKGDVNDLSALSCIDNLSQSLIAKISAAQNLISKGQTRAAVNTLAALIHEVQAQAGKHISTACKDPNGRSFDPVQLLLEDARYLQLSVAGQLAANPILGWVVNSGGAGIAGVTVNLMNSSATVIGMATTDATGFYYFADTSTIGLTPGTNCSLNVTIPTGYSSSTPASQTFTWSANSVVGNFMLN